MLWSIIFIFIVGYLAIVLEHPLQINKTAFALLTGILCWAAMAVMTPEPWMFELPQYKVFIERHQDNQHIGFIGFVSYYLEHHLGEISQILFFLLGAMTIVELVDAHHGFRIVTDRITTQNPRVLLWIIAILTFFLSAILDNLTTSIVLVSVLRKIIKDPDLRKFFAGVVIIAANSGGAWSPIGDVTTTMLWIGGQITTPAVIKSVFIPSVISMVVPLIFITFMIKDKLMGDNTPPEQDKIKGREIIFFSGIMGLLSVPVFKTYTHLPPYMGMLLALGAIWLISEVVHKRTDHNERLRFTAAHALSRIDTSSVLFFLGILLAVSSLETLGVLAGAAGWLTTTVGDMRVIALLIGAASAIVDNVPVVAASMGMYSITDFPVDDHFWLFLTYASGTGGSMLIIGSAAGVAVMGIEKIDFIWYLKKISWLALIGYLAGALWFFI